MSDSDEQDNDPRQHINDWEWLYQHGYLDGTLYGARRRLGGLFRQIWVAMSAPVYWLMDRMTDGLNWLTQQMRRHS